MSENYFLGIDAGTDSVGWAVTDEEYRLLKARGNDLWGSYLFDAAVTAAERRAFRTARRRIARVRYRLSLLQELFAEEISKVDPTFFLRLNDSKLLMDDKNEKIVSKYVIFADEGYNDKDFYKQYPTIFHLRAALINGEIKDIRLLYIAIHHIIKNRGHFLFEDQTFGVGSPDCAREAFNKINAILTDTFVEEGNDPPVLELSNIDDVLKLILNTSMGKNDKYKKLCGLLCVEKNKKLQAIVGAIIGKKITLSDLYPELVDSEPIKFSFDSSDFDESAMPKIERALGVEETELVRQLKAIYDWAALNNILCGNQYISLAKIEIYNKHKHDLEILKKYIRNNCPEKYNLTFRHKEKIDNYAAYIGMDKKRGYEKTSKDKFYAFLKKTIFVKDEYILAEIEKGTFLPKQITGGNGVIPYQVHLAELKAILNNAEKNYAFLSKESDGYTVKEKIISLMTFRVPYYVGPLNNESKQFAWSIRRAGEERTKVTPWNFDKVIDKDASEEEFIQRMTNKCTYLIGEDVLPKSSLLYSKFVFLNEINNLMVMGAKDAKATSLIINYAKSHKKVTLKAVKKLLEGNGIIENPKLDISEVFSGIDEEIKNGMASYVELRGIVGDKVETHSEMCEDIIKMITIISDKRRLFARIKKTYGKQLSDEEITQLAALNYSEWGNLSKKLLTEIKSPKFYDEQTGELMSIIDGMEKTGKNFMQLMSNDCGFPDVIKEYNGNQSNCDKVTYKTVEDLYCSPSVKRAIWRTLTLTKEIVKIRGCAPKKIFIEMARGAAEDQKNKRTSSRKQQLLDLYKNIEQDKQKWIKDISDREDRVFDSDKIFLYYTQMGRCMYTGEKIPFDMISDSSNIYDIDHIYPQSKIKDDSLTNRVLSNKQFNSNIKKDIYPLSEDIRRKMLPFWTALLKNKMISEAKYKRLTRNAPLSAEELGDFVERQIVETRQSTKATAELLKQMYPETEICYVKSRLAADFKQDNNLIKLRELNDLHHAKDAYINIVVGNVQNVKYGHNPSIFFRTHREEEYNIKNPYSKEIKDAWKPEYTSYIGKTYNKNSCKVVRFSGEGKGGLFKATIKTAGANDKLVPLKAKGAIADTSRYGGYDSATTAYFTLVKSEGKKGKALLSLECITILADKEIGGDTQTIEAFCKETLGLVNPKVVIAKIKLNTLIRINGSYAYLRGRTGDRIVLCNATELLLDNDSVIYLKRVVNFINKEQKLNIELTIDDKRDLLTVEENIKLYDVLTQKLASTAYAGLSISGQSAFLIKERSSFVDLTIKEQCKVIMQILNLLQCNSKTADFTLMSGVSKAGVILTSKNIQDNDVQFIYQSPTGYYSSKIDIKNFL